MPYFAITYDIVQLLNTKERRTLDAIFRRPVPADIRWEDIKSLFRACGVEITQGNGSRIRVKCNDIRMTFHEPHKGETDKGTVQSVRKFLRDAGVLPE